MEFKRLNGSPIHFAEGFLRTDQAGDAQVLFLNNHILCVPAVLASVIPELQHESEFCAPLGPQGFVVFQRDRYILGRDSRDLRPDLQKIFRSKCLDLGENSSTGQGKLRLLKNGKSENSDIERCRTDGSNWDIFADRQQLDVLASGFLYQIEY